MLMRPSFLFHYLLHSSSIRGKHYLCELYSLVEGLWVMSAVAIKQSTSVLRYNLLAGVVCDINPKAVQKQGRNKTTSYCLSLLLE